MNCGKASGQFMAAHPGHAEITPAAIAHGGPVAQANPWALLDKPRRVDALAGHYIFIVNKTHRGRWKSRLHQPRDLTNHPAGQRKKTA